jgi:Ca2+-dependent lipid-binding protein
MLCSSVHPFWNETEFVIIQDLQCSKLRFEVMDDNKLKKDSFLGYSEFPLNVVKEGGCEEV